MIIQENRLLDEILGGYREVIGGDFEGYKNHVYRMVNFCLVLDKTSEEETEKIIIAGCFHDIGIWTAGTFDYLSPSIDAANEYLEGKDLIDWKPEIERMIDQHHKVRSFSEENDKLVEIFRKGDLVDFSLGLVKCGLPRATVNAIRNQFPNAGFHKGLVRLAGSWFCRHPLNPVPVIKW